MTTWEETWEETESKWTERRERKREREREEERKRIIKKKPTITLLPSFRTPLGEIT